MARLRVRRNRRIAERRTGAEHIHDRRRAEHLQDHVGLHADRHGLAVRDHREVIDRIVVVANRVGREGADNRGRAGVRHPRIQHIARVVVERRRLAPEDEQAVPRDGEPYDVIARARTDEGIERIHDREVFNVREPHLRRVQLVDQAVPVLKDDHHRIQEGQRRDREHVRRERQHVQKAAADNRQLRMRVHRAVDGEEDRLAVVVDVAARREDSWRRPLVQLRPEDAPRLPIFREPAPAARGREGRFEFEPRRAVERGLLRRAGDFARLLIDVDRLVRAHDRRARAIRAADKIAPQWHQAPPLVAKYFIAFSTNIGRSMNETPTLHVLQSNPRIFPLPWQ